MLRFRQAQNNDRKSADSSEQSDCDVNIKVNFIKNHFFFIQINKFQIIKKEEKDFSSKNALFGYVNNCNCYEFDALASEKTSDPSSPFKNSEINQELSYSFNNSLNDTCLDQSISPLAKPELSKNCFLSKVKSFNFN